MIKDKKYLILATLSLGLSGIFSVFVVFLRLSFFTNLIPNIFDISLALHVNLSVNFWMILIAMHLWSNQQKNIFQFYSYTFCAAGIFFVFFSGFAPGSQVIKSNYVPFMDNIFFTIGIALFFFGAFLSAARSIYTFKQNFYESTIAILFCISILTAAFALNKMPNNILLLDFYESLFWGFGHVLQFVFCQTLIVVYYHLVDKDKKCTVLNYFSAFNLLAVLPLPFLYLFFDSDQQIFKDIFTYHMRLLGGIAPFAVILHLILNTESSFAKTAFIASSALFIYGGMLGFLIKESNVIIPAHYHGSIVGITIAFMAFCYKDFNILKNKSSKIQLLSYASGQFMHITGLVLMGGYGALRKTAGMTSDASPFYKALFGLGGALSIISGALFVYLALAKIIRMYYLHKNI